MAGLSPTADINTNPLAAAQFSLMYGPQTQQALRRSQYLADALRELQSSGQQPIRGWGELGSKLLANALLMRANNKGQDLLSHAMAADQQDETTRMLAPLQATDQGPAPQPPAPEPPPAPDPPPQPPPEQPPQAAPTATPSAYSPQDRDALIRMGAVEAGGEGPDGIAAAMHVALNRYKAGYGGAKSLADVIHQPHQFTGIQNGVQPDPQALAMASQVADGVLSGQVPDRTGGAMAFLNPDLTQKLYGRIPPWAQGPGGQRIGNHVFFGGGQQAQNAAPPPAPPPPPNPNGPDVQAVGGAGPDTLPPQQGAQPSPAPQQPPQASQVPPPAALPHNWPTWKPSADELHYVQGLLVDPHTHQAGIQAALKMRERMAEPVPAEVQLINGVPFYVAKDPSSGVPTMAIPVPQAAMTQHAPASPGMPKGTEVDQTPLGARTVVYKPPEGFEAAPGGGLTDIHGGPADPMRPQAPAAGYQYAPHGGVQSAIPGSAADPRAPINVAAAAERLQAAIRPTIDLARESRQDFGNVETGYRLQNGSGDVAMLKGINQLITRGAVRPNDVDQQLKSDGLAGGIGELTQFLSSQGKLTPETRAKVYRAAQALYAASDQQFKSQVLGHRATTDAIYGDGSFDKFVFPAQEAQALGWAPPPPGAPPAAPIRPDAPVLKPGTREAAQAEARRRGLIP